MRVDENCINRQAYTKESFVEYYGPDGFKKWDSSTPLPLGAQHMSIKEIEMSPAVRKNTKQTSGRCLAGLINLEQAGKFKLITAPSLINMGEVTEDGLICSYAKQNTLLYHNGVSILGILPTAPW